MFCCATGLILLTLWQQYCIDFQEGNNALATDVTKLTLINVIQKITVYYLLNWSDLLALMAVGTCIYTWYIRDAVRCVVLVPPWIFLSHTHTHTHTQCRQHPKEEKLHDSLVRKLVATDWTFGEEGGGGSVSVLDVGLSWNGNRSLLKGILYVYKTRILFIKTAHWTVSWPTTTSHILTFVARLNIICASAPGSSQGVRATRL
jgi:hypothetical protein